MFPLAKIRGYSGAAVNQARADNWQPLALVVKALRPVARLPKRLHMDFCWATFHEFSAAPASTGQPFSYTELYFPDFYAGKCVSDP